ncbi:MAG: ATP-binding protein [Paludibacteraceae bacterium]|nr:ATP-binding protein [Paludibacteraceae bacterium]
MYQRVLSISETVEDMSVFLFGARQTGKSTYLRQAFPNALYIDLLDSSVRRVYKDRPSVLYDQLADGASQVVIIDEITEVPELLNEVHRLIFKNDTRFILCAGSARKLRRQGANTLGGRANPCYFYPLVSAEVPDLNIDRAVTVGMIPNHYLAKRPETMLSAYINVYLQQEIKAEAIVRNVDAFERFMEVAALTNGDIVNYSNIASDCGVHSETIKEYFAILEDTLIGYMIPAYHKSLKRKEVQAPKFYYFDAGIANYLLRRNQLQRGTVEYGQAFEHFVIRELIAYLGYSKSRERLSYWHTYSGSEVDAIIGNRMAIEIKSTDIVKPKHLRGLKAFADEYSGFERILVSFDPITRTTEDGIRLIPIHDFLKKLWANELI